MNTIVTLIDFSGLTPKLIEVSQRYAEFLKARVILLNILAQEKSGVATERGSTNIAEHSNQEWKAEDQKSLAELGNILSATGVDVLVEQLEDADIRKALEECERWKADLIIVGAHHHSAIYNWFVGSFTCEVLQGAHCPVLVVPPIPVQGMGQMS